MELQKKSAFHKRFLLCTSFLIIFFANTAYAAIYYVNNSGSPACSNISSNGTDAKPWCSINYGLSRIGSGDTLYVKSGTYHEDVYINGPAGSAGTPTTISAYPGHTVTILGDGINSGRVKIDSTSYVTFNGFNITNFNQGLFVVSSHHIMVSHCTVYNIGQEGMHVLTASHDVIIDACTVHDTGTWAYDGEGIYVGTSTSGSYDNTYNVTISNTTIYNTTNEAIELKPGTHGCIIDGNTIYSANTVNNGYGGAAIEVNQAVASPQHYDSDPQHIIRNNTIHDVGPTPADAFFSSAIRAGTGCSVYNNVIYNITSPGRGIFSDNQANDSYTRKIYHNTVDVASARAIVNVSGTMDSKNNIGPNTPNNLATSNAFYVSEPGRNYHLVAGAAPIGAGVNLLSMVPTDKDGVTRTLPVDTGAYRYGTSLSPPQNLRVVQQ